jgi:NNP family nitrate/nitrite transporter-like MFS transporter
VSRATRWIHHWDPEDTAFWESTGRRIARRNLIFSIFVEHLGFTVWLLWSAVVVTLPAAGFAFTVDQLFWLVALPNLVGATLRLPYTLAVPRFGGRNWTVVSALLLLLPTTLLAIAISDPATPYWFFVLAAATAGLGGGNFASGMANVSFFYPERAKGVALGLNAAGGNLGVTTAQLAVPLIIGGGSIAGAGLLWVPFILVAAVCAWLFMDNLTTARSPVRDQLVVLRRAHTWIVSFLYIGTFGSFIGYSAALPLLITVRFEAVAAVHYAFLGPLVGSLARPVGGWLSDRVGGARVTVATFAAMAAGVAGVLGGLRLDSFPIFLGSFLLLFVASGAGNGSTYRMIPAIFQAHARRTAKAADAPAAGRREAAAVIGIASAIGAYGGFLIPRGLGTAIAGTGEVAAALYSFFGFYLLCIGVTWWCYLRRRASIRRERSDLARNDQRSEPRQNVPIVTNTHADLRP